MEIQNKDNENKVHKSESVNGVEEPKGKIVEPCEDIGEIRKANNENTEGETHHNKQHPFKGKIIDEFA